MKPTEFLFALASVGLMALLLLRNLDLDHHAKQAEHTSFVVGYLRGHPYPAAQAEAEEEWLHYRRAQQ